MKNKISLIFAIVFTMIITLNTIFAVEIYDSKTIEDVYKASEDNSEFKLPFVRLAGGRMDIDKAINQTGAYFAISSIDVNAPLSGVQVFFSDDTVRVNSDIDYAIIFSSKNVVVNASVDNTLLVYCGGTVTFTENANVKGNVICYSPNLEVNGNIDGNILGSVSTAKVNGIVSGSIRMAVDKIDFNDNAKVEQGIYINTSNKELKIDESKGESTIDTVEVEKESFGDWALRVVDSTVLNLLIFLLILIFIKKDNLNKIVNKLENKRIPTSGLKAYVILLAMICLGIVLLAILPSLGISAIVIASAIMLVVTLLKNAIFGTIIVKLFERKNDVAQVKLNTILVTVITFLLLEIMENIPYVGQIISFVVFILTIGILYCLITKENNDAKKEPETIVAK